MMGCCAAEEEVVLHSPTTNREAVSLLAETKLLSYTAHSIEMEYIDNVDEGSIHYPSIIGSHRKD